LIKDNETTNRIIKAAVSDFVFHSANKPAGELTVDSPLAIPLARAAMSAYTYGRLDEAKSLAGQFKSLEEYEKGAAEIMTKTTGITDWFSH